MESVSVLMLFSVAELGWTRQHSNEYLDVYVSIFRENTLDCCDPVHVITKEYRVFVIYLPLLRQIAEGRSSHQRVGK